MKRITSKNHNRYKSRVCAGWKKLQLLEDIEDELGVDLITLFRAFKDDVYIKLEDGRIIEGFGAMIEDNPRFIYFSVHGEDVNSIADYDSYGVHTKDYGKTWAFVEEELEKW